MGTRTHEFWRATREDRAALTANLAAPYGSTIVFCRTKRGVDRLTKQLCQAGLYAVPIHGDRSQAQRDRALAQFRERSAQVLVGTDVAARGIHVDDVDCVIHFDPPEDEDTYIHRSGRTGRAGGAGRVVSLISREQEGPSQKMQRNLKIASSFIDPPRPGPLPKIAMRPAPPMPQPNGNANGGKGGPRPAYAGGRNSSSSNQGASTSYSAARRRNRRGGPAAPRPAVSAGASPQRSGDWQRSGDAPRSATPRRRPR